jgi:hypothetical protein
VPRRRTALLGLLACLGGLACAEAPDVEIVATRELGLVEHPAGVASRERGSSVLAFGRSVWLFGDTVLTSPDANGSSLRRSSWATTIDLGAQNGVGDFVVRFDDAGGPAELLTRTAEELDADSILLTPLASVRDDPNSRTLVFYSKQVAASVGPPTPIGTGVAVWTSLEFGPIRPVLDAGSDEPTLLFRAPEPEFGQALLVEGERLYAYGCRDELYQPCALARVALAELFTRDAWEFWTGRDWSPDSADAVALVEADRVLSVTRNDLVDRYLLYYAAAQPEGGGELRVRSARAPEGPWSEPISVLRVPADPSGSPLADVLAHPEYRRGGGQFELLSYRLGADLHLLEVELAPGT